ATTIRGIMKVLSLVLLSVVSTMVVASEDEVLIVLDAEEIEESSQVKRMAPIYNQKFNGVVQFADPFTSPRQFNRLSTPFNSQSQFNHRYSYLPSNGHFSSYAQPGNYHSYNHHAYSHPLNFNTHLNGNQYPFNPYFNPYYKNNYYHSSPNNFNHHNNHHASHHRYQFSGNNQFNNVDRQFFNNQLNQNQR
ncbi:unnamed protein product, partial [Meganyctiphanes norvegica]